MDFPTGALGLPTRMASSADAIDVAIGMFALRRDNRGYARHCTVRGAEGRLIPSRGIMSNRKNRERDIIRVAAERDA
jgi:hypothetical protein